MTDTTKPMEGLAEWLRRMAAGESDAAARLYNKWASEVEAACASAIAGVQEGPRPMCKACNGRGWESVGTRCAAPGCHGGYIGTRGVPPSHEGQQ